MLEIDLRFGPVWNPGRQKRVCRMRTLFFSFGAIVLIAAVTACVLFQFSPWPSVLFQRQRAERQGLLTARALERYVPAEVAAQLNLQYDSEDADARLDVFYPAEIEKSEQLLPTIVWVHGGEWIYGSKDYIANYLRLVASKGFTAVGVNYALAPARTYPAPVEQINAALGFISRNADRLHADPQQLFLAGDSAGSQIAAQVANVISVASYAAEVGIVPSIKRSQLRGVVLYCGMYDAGLADFERNGVLWAYFGTKDFKQDPRFSQFSVARHITSNFPPMFLAAGNDDPLASQSYVLAEKAGVLGVPVDSLFFPQGTLPKVPHEFQFQLETKAAWLALDRSIKFMTERLR